MTQQQAPTRDQLIASLRRAEDAVVQRLGKLSADDLESGCYESGWNGRQVLAHIASIEWSYPRLIEVARSGPPQPSGETRPAESSYKPPERQAGGGINDYNQRQIERYAEASAQELIEVFRKNRAATIAAVEAADDALLAAPVKSAGGLTGPLGNVMELVAVHHVLGHVRDIETAAAAP
jgi:hypothetical protein